MNSNFRFSRLLLLSAIAMGTTLAASAQTVVPEPFVTLYAGQGNGAAFPTLCTNPIPDTNNLASNTATNPKATIILGNGCLPAQSIVADVYDVKVDPQGDIYIAEENTSVFDTSGNSYQTGDDVRVVYNGGTALYNALIAANPQISNFIPQLGHIYTLAGSLAASISAYNGNFYCGSSPALSAGGLIGYNLLGDGCPAAMSRITPRGIAIDNDGNVIIANDTTHYGTRVVYVGGTKMYNLIKLLNPTVNVPQVGYIYQLGFNGGTGDAGDGALATQSFGNNPRYVAVDSNDNIYLSDGTSSSSAVINGVTTTISASNENVRVINGTTGIITTVAGETECSGVGNTTYNGHNYFPYSATYGCPLGFSGDGGPATSALFNYPFVLAIDQYNNLYIGDYANGRVRVLYQGGTLAVLANQGITPVVGSIYTYFGGTASSGVQGSLTVDNTLAQNVKLTETSAIGFDKGNNLWVLDGSSHYVWRVDAVTGIANIVAGGASSTGGVKQGAFCTGTSGPVSVDNFGHGCPAILAYVQGQGSISFDPQGNFYIGSNNTAGTFTAPSTTPTLAVYEYSFNNTFPATAVGSSATQYMAFSSTVSNALTSRTFTEEGAATTEFSDALNTSCAPAGTLAVKATCIVGVKFTPSHAGERLGKLAFNTATTTPGTQFISGSGIASDLAIDNGTVSTLGTGLTPSGVGTDLLGNVYVADSASGRLLKGPSSGTTLVPLTTPVTGLSKPSQVAIDNAGNIYIADTGNNRIVVTTSTGTPIINLGTGLSGPQGVVVDQYGNIFVADTGNNRILQFALNGNQLPFNITPPNAAFKAPTQLALDFAGNLYILDSGNKRIVENNQVSGIPSVTALDLNVIPTAFALDAAGDIYVSDSATGTVRDYYTGITPGFSLITGFVSPVGLAVDADANVFVADTSMIGAIELRRTIGAISLPEANAVVGPATSAAVTVNNVGNSALTFSTPLDTISGTGAAAFSLAPSTTNGCGAGISYAPGGLCNFTASFLPPAAGPYTGTATFNSNATNTGVANAQLTGTGNALPVATTTTLSLGNATPIYYSSPVQLTAVLKPATLTTTPTGFFVLTVDGKTVEPPVAVTAADLTTGQLFSIPLFAGTHTLSVTYSPSAAPYEASASSTTVTIIPAVTKTSISVTPQSVNGVGSLLFSSTVTATTAVAQTGTVSIWAGLVGTGTLVCSSPIDPVTYTITCTTSLLSFPVNTFTAAYSGSPNGNFAPSQSAPYTPPTGDFLVAPVISTFSVPQGGVGQLNINVVPLFASSGNVLTSCSGLPANSVCRFTPNNIALAPVSTSAPLEVPIPVLVQIYTNVNSALASNQKPTALDHSEKTREIVLAFGLPLGLGLLCLRRRSKLRLLAMLVLGVSMVAGVSGCGGTASLQTFSNLVTPTGTYNLLLTFTGQTGSGETQIHTVPATFTILPAAAQYPGF